MNDMKNLPESYWKEKLTPDQYKVVRQKGTERAFSGALYYTMKRECTIVSHAESHCSPQTPSLNLGLDGLALMIK